ncbi:MAG: cyclase family protein [Spirochaetes bacterium]|nr:cyclase family protein [Spirochaetota bacterium]
MKFYDITVPILNTMPVWPGDPPVIVERTKSISKGNSCNLTSLAMGVHCGTHIDAPLHFMDRGRAVDDIPLDVLNGPCRVVGIDAKSLIEKKHIENLGLGGYKRILFKTANSELWKNNTAAFYEGFTALGLSAAEYLAELGVSLVGIDYLSIESFHAEKEHPVHKMLLKNNIVILESVDLSGVQPAEYELVCLPLRITGAEGAPVRAVLYEKS